MFIIVTGNPGNGFEYVGPFDTAEDAMQWVDKDAILREEWWVTRLEPKSAFERQDYTGEES